MIFNTRYIALAALASALVSSLPLDNIVPRAKSYSVINVDGGAPTQAPADVTTIVESTTKTVEVTNPGPTVTAEVTATIVEPVPAPSATSNTSSSTSSSSSSKPTPTSTSTTITPTSTETPKPVLVTVTVTTDDGPTEYYDSGMWHTSYRIKSLEAVTAGTLLSTVSAIAPGSTALPAW